MKANIEERDAEIKIEKIPKTKEVLIIRLLAEFARESKNKTATNIKPAMEFGCEKVEYGLRNCLPKTVKRDIPGVVELKVLSPKK